MEAPAAPTRTPAIDGPRPALPAEVPEIVALVDAEMREGTDQSMLTDYPLVYAPSNLRNVRVLRAGGELVSVVPVLPREAVLLGRRIRIGIISPTATVRAHRHRGYASRCLESAIEAMSDAGCALSVLWTLVETFPFYERAGYHPVPFQGVAYGLDAPVAGSFADDPGLSISPLDIGDDAALEAIRGLHDADGDGEGIRRDAAETRALFALPKLRTLVGRRDGAIAGYVAVSDSVNKPGLIEAGGDASAVEALIHAVLAGLPAGATVDAHALATPTLIGGILAARVPERRRVVADGMMIRVNDVDTLLGGPPPFELTTTEWAAALFGSHPARPAAPSELGYRLGLPVPVSLPIPVLDRS